MPRYFEFLTLASAMLLGGCANELSYEMTSSKMIYVPDYADTESSQTTVSMPCHVAQERAANMLRTTTVGVSKLEPNRLTTTVHKYQGATRGLLFKTRYTENLVFVFDFSRTDNEQRSCQVALRGMVCERPDDAVWDCVKTRDLSRAEVLVTAMLKRFEQEAK